MKPSTLLCLVLLEVGLVPGIFDLCLSHLFDLVLVDDQHLAVEGLVVELLLGHCGRIMLLVADKGKGGADLLSFVKTDVLELTEGAE